MTYSLLQIMHQQEPSTGIKFPRLTFFIFEGENGRSQPCRGLPS